MNISQTETRLHFYYCLLIALHIAKQKGEITSMKTKRRFIVNWLNHARLLPRFGDEIDDEVSWLSQQLQVDVYLRTIEARIYHIYRYGQVLCLPVVTG